MSAAGSTTTTNRRTAKRVVGFATTQALWLSRQRETAPIGHLVDTSVVGRGVVSSTQSYPGERGGTSRASIYL